MRAGDFAARLARIHGDHVRSSRWHRRAARALVKRARAIPIFTHNRVVGYRMTDGAVACAKHRYRDQAAADAELVRIARHAVRDYVPVRAYRCEFCNGWHLTSRQ